VERKLILVRNACIFLSKCRRHHGGALQRVVGHLAWFFPLKRCLFSILGSVYQFIDTVGDHWAYSWKTVKAEFSQAAHLLWFTRSSLSRPQAPLIVCTDAEGANNKDYGGGASVVCGLDPDALNEILDGEDWFVSPGVHGGPAEQFLQSKTWYILEQRRWIYKEPIHLGELQAVVNAVARVVRANICRGCTLTVFTDSSVVYYGLRKGRSSKLSIRARLQRLTAWLLVGDIELDVRWIPSRFCVADGPSRSRCVPVEEARRHSARIASKQGDARSVRDRLEPFRYVVRDPESTSEK
jgi:hypothetical protein